MERDRKMKIWHNALLSTVLVESVSVKKYTKMNIEKMKSLFFCMKIAKRFAFFCQFLLNLKFVKMSLEFVHFRADFYLNFTKSCRINKNNILAEKCEI